MTRPGFKPWSDSSEHEDAAAEALAAHERDEAERAAETVRRNNAEREAANTAAMLAAARVLLAEVVGLERRPVTHEALCARLKIADGEEHAETARGLLLLLHRASDEQDPDRQTIHEAQSVGKQWLGIRYIPLDGRDRFDDHDPHDERRRCYTEKRLSVTSVMAQLKREGHTG
jgi:hypothetical protein